MEPNRVAVVIKDAGNQWEGLRSSLGLGVEMIDTHLFVIGKINMPASRAGIYKEGLEFLKSDLEGKTFTDNLKNVESWGVFEYLPLPQMTRRLREYDLIIPF